MEDTILTATKARNLVKKMNVVSLCMKYIKNHIEPKIKLAAEMDFIKEDNNILYLNSRYLNIICKLLETKFEYKTYAQYNQHSRNISISWYSKED